MGMRASIEPADTNPDLVSVNHVNHGDPRLNHMIESKTRDLIPFACSNYRRAISRSNLRSSITPTGILP